jgi:purine-nucleoside phosphorylase
MLISKVSESISQIRKFTEKKVEIGLILGSGLAPIADRLENKVSIPYSDIPHFKESTAPGHEGHFIFGDLAGIPLLCMQGRLHYYEGYSMQEVTYPIRVMAKLGVKKLIITNACGGLDPDSKPGDLMLITDHINFTGSNPLIGANEDDFGPRFPDMTRVYDRDLQNLALRVAADLDIPLSQGVYIGYGGPSFETPAEIRWMQTWGAHAVGMSTVPEAIVAVHSGIRVLGLSCITNLAAGILDEPLSSEEVIVAAGEASAKFVLLLSEIISRM